MSASAGTCIVNGRPKTGPINCLSRCQEGKILVKWAAVSLGHHPFALPMKRQRQLAAVYSIHTEVGSPSVEHGIDESSVVVRTRDFIHTPVIIQIKMLRWEWILAHDYFLLPERFLADVKKLNATSDSTEGRDKILVDRGKWGSPKWTVVLGHFHHRNWNVFDKSER